MDYKYIEQLLERYWQCETSLEEETVLRAFFAQSELPAHLARYRSLFEYERQASAEHLGEDFDRRLIAIVEAEKPLSVKARRINMTRRLMPLYRAAASVAIILLVVPAAWTAFNRPQEVQGWDYNAAEYTDSYSTPQEAYEQLDYGMRELQNAFSLTGRPLENDSVADNANTVAE